MCVLDSSGGPGRPRVKSKVRLLGLRSHGVGARAYDVVCVDTDRQVVGNLARTPGVRLPGFSNAGFECCSGAPALDREQVLAPRAARTGVARAAAARRPRVLMRQFAGPSDLGIPRQGRDEYSAIATK